jgi:A/G-specific adenine glycosylase
VRRVLARHAAVAGHPGLPAVQKTLWAEAEARLPHTRLADYTQALMDLGSRVCTARQPHCTACPVAWGCAAHAQNRVAEFPSPRPRRARGAQQALLLLIRDPRQRLLLERRPPAGIWGGLWCTPLVAAGEDWREACAGRGLEIIGDRALAPVHHAFTHFDLRLDPLCVQARAATTLQDSATAWLTIPQALALGLPAPLRRLLETSTLAPEPATCPEPSTA